MTKCLPKEEDSEIYQILRKLKFEEYKFDYTFGQNDVVITVLPQNFLDSVSALQLIF
jgi:hypothetical protein